jgi:receptor protein-tyrosine kinase
VFFAVELRDYLDIVRKRWVVIVAITAITVAAILAFSFIQKPVYEAKATCMVSATNTGSDQYAAMQIIEQLLQTINKIAVSRPVLEDASNRLSHSASANQLEKAATSEVVTNTQLIVIHARDVDPTKAMLKANAVADSLIDFVNLKGGANSTYKIEKVETALTPESPISPRPVRNGILGVFLGLILGLAGAAVVEFIDVSVKSKEELGQLLELPVLAEIPLSSEEPVDSKLKASQGESEILEQTRTLRTNIQYLDIHANLRTILITSPNLGEGKTFIGKQLARAFAAAGKNVVLVDADLRKVEHSLNKNAGSPGLTDAIMGTVDLMSVVSRTKTERFWILPSGPLPPNPSELLDSESMQSILDSLQTGFDVVIVDSSPIRMFSDPLVLASKVDGIILVAEARSTSGESLKAAAELLTGPNINLLGTVLNKVNPSRRHRDYYYYHRSTQRAEPPKK